MFNKIKERLVESGWLEDKDSSSSKKQGKETEVEQPILSSELPSSAFTTSIGSAAPTEPDEKYLTFVAGELSKLNLAGIDSFELSAAMRKLINKGMSLPTAIQAAYETFASTNSDLTVQKLTESCDYYLSGLQNILNEFFTEKDNDAANTKSSIENTISMIEKRSKEIETEEQKLTVRLRELADEKQQNVIAKQKQETELQNALHDAENRKINMKLAVLKVSSVIQEDKAAILQHLK